ncbi:MAG: hypothetical protein HFH14_06105 [Lachnospiraceae bacterium]|nr:hypothetical protein [Lachnospiraceae bacterium]
MYIIKDLKAFCNSGGIGKVLATVFLNPCFHSVLLYRISSFFNRIHLKIVAKIIWYINRVVYNVDIDYRAKLSGGFVLVHGIGTVIGCNVVSEGRLTVYQGCTLGGNQGRSAEYRGVSIVQPVLQDGVVIYTNACVFGPAIIGKNVKIKAGSIITHNIGTID